MKEMTEDSPKCLVKLAGKALLTWQLQAFQAASITKLLVVKGYKEEKIQGDFATVINTDWASTNMLSSLLCANTFIEEHFSRGYNRVIVSYSDIVYHPAHITKLLSAQGDIALTYDVLWKDLWTLRFGDPLRDAETFKEEDGILKEIGDRPKSLDQIAGQYMGLLSFTRPGWQIVQDTCKELAVPTMDMTGFLRELLRRKIQIKTVPVEGKWCETDSQDDRAKYELALQSNNWSHDWRW